MIKIDSNFICIEIYDKDVLENERRYLLKIKELYHQSDIKAISNIHKSKVFRFTPFEKQLSEQVFSPSCKGSFYQCCFSTEQISKEIIENQHFKGKETINAALKIKFDNIFDLFDKESCCVLVDSEKRHNICFVGHNSKRDDTADNDFINDLFLRIRPVSVAYVTNNINNTNLFIDKNCEMVICTSVGKRVKEKYSYQKELRFVAELLSTKEISIKNPIWLEIKLKENIELEIINLT